MVSVLGMCLDRRVLIGLAVIAVGIWALAPDLILGALPLLLLAACPLSMLLMMRMMSSHGQTSVPGATPATRLAALERDQARFAEEIAHARAEMGRVEADSGKSMKRAG
ncbi:MAG: DUF2933 domain-containing protein [Thermoleophilaceae bacterium]